MQRDLVRSYMQNRPNIFIYVHCVYGYQIWTSFGLFHWPSRSLSIGRDWGRGGQKRRQMDRHAWHSGADAKAEAADGSVSVVIRPSDGLFVLKRLHKKELTSPSPVNVSKHMKDGLLFFFLPLFYQLLSPQLKQGQAEPIQTRKALINWPRRLLFLLKSL